ncbi:deoxyribodipyrimidine photo-lyase [soil metagenome]
MSAPALVWLRDDLRLSYNPALTAAAASGGPVVAVYVLDEESPEVRPLGGASRWWLHHSLAALNESMGGCLVLRRGRAEEVIPALAAELDAPSVHWNRRYGAAREIDARLKTLLGARSHHANLLFEPWTVTTGEGTPFKVFTPFWRAAREQLVRDPLPVPSIDWATAPGDTLDEWGLLPTRPDWASGLREMWTPGEAGGQARLESFATDALERYDRRDEPAVVATSHLSPHLRFGEVSPFQVWARVHGVLSPAARRNASKLLSELGWREFNWSILFHNTDLATRNYRAAFDAFPWSEPDPEVLAAWCEGRTGIPLVDAGMRELWRTGYMHNRVRMVTASFLIKNLLVDWRVGEQWFWDTLVDADEASNPGNWQWVAGSGADAAPYFRVFNPLLQATKFDPSGQYVNRWVPEAGTPGYPEPIVDLKATRAEALEAYEHVKRAAR